LDELICRFSFDVNAIDNEGRTAGMYLVMKGRYYINLNHTKGDYAILKSIITDKKFTFINLKNTVLK